MLRAQSVTIAWTPSVSASVAGYQVDYGTDGVTFPYEVDAGTNLSLTVTNLEPGSTNYFEVLAYRHQYGF